MKKIIISIIVLFFAIIAMAYLYFSKLNTDQNKTDIGLHAAVAVSSFVFSFENDKNITDILNEQNLFEEILGEKKYKQFCALKSELLSLPRINVALDKQPMYIGFLPGNGQEIDYLCCTQFSNKENIQQLLQSVKTRGTAVSLVNEVTKLTLADSSIFYLGNKENLLVLSNSEKQITAVLNKDLSRTDDKFMSYIQNGKRFTKNSLAQLYINFNGLPAILKNIIPGKLTGELSIFHNQNSFASLTYNFSNEKILLTGATIINDPNSYYQLFSAAQTQKININNILPENTAFYTIFAIDDYVNWRKKLNTWFLNKKEDKKINALIADINTRYHLNTDNIFAAYFKNQLLTFQLSTTERIGAINLSNGDKMNQLLIDLSSDYNEEIKVLKEADLLYAYFGQAFIDFRKPYYTILDNYMIFANNASTLQSFLNDYRGNKLLTNTSAYIRANNQLPGNSNISFYIDHHNASEILRNNIYVPYYKHINAEKGLRKYESFIYQLSGDNGKFQTNVLINKQPDKLQKDSLAL